jgi:hypothetical protein
VAVHDLVKGRAVNQFQVNGADPFVIFALAEPLKPADARYLSIDLTCDDGTPSVPVQVFWLESGQAEFDEQRSVRFTMQNGQNLLDLRTIQGWATAPAISRVRVDIDPGKTCPQFRLANPALGVGRP